MEGREKVRMRAHDEIHPMAIFLASLLLAGFRDDVPPGGEDPHSHHWNLFGNPADGLLTLNE
jgi:hypothetical protein